MHLAVGDFPRKVQMLDFKPIYMEQHFLYCSVGHPLFDQDDRRITRNAIRRCNVVGRTYTNGMDLRQAGVDQPSAIVSNIECMAFMILSGHYIGFLPNHYAEQWTNVGRLRPVQPGRYHYSSTFHVTTRKGMPRNLVTETFIKDLESVLQSHGELERKSN